MRAGSRASGWFDVMMSMRPGVSTHPSSTSKRPARLSSSGMGGGTGGQWHPAGGMVGGSGGGGASDMLSGGKPEPGGGGTGGGPYFAVSSQAAGGRGRGLGVAERWLGLTVGAVLADDDASEGLHLPSSAYGPSSSCRSAPSRRWTMLEHASMSSITKMRSEKVRRRDGSPPMTSRVRSYMMSASCVFVCTCASETLMIERPVWWASALMSEVLPVPGGPWSRRPTFCGKPATAYLPVPRSKSASSLKSESFCGKKSDEKVLWSESACRL
mmetsp:Transcript_9482/g.31432  ORF Transcript_9482/g.31432 Transcript_9482/m.31432 type:complete len:270 (+) Transcript_9482:356-1165(+)